MILFYSRIGVLSFAFIVIFQFHYDLILFKELPHAFETVTIFQFHYDLILLVLILIVFIDSK